VSTREHVRRACVRVRTEPNPNPNPNPCVRDRTERAENDAAYRAKVLAVKAHIRQPGSDASKVNVQRAERDAHAREVRSIERQLRGQIAAERQVALEQRKHVCEAARAARYLVLPAPVPPPVTASLAAPRTACGGGNDADPLIAAPRTARGGGNDAVSPAALRTARGGGHADEETRGGLCSSTGEWAVEAGGAEEAGGGVEEGSDAGAAQQCAASSGAEMQRASPLGAPGGGAPEYSRYRRGARVGAHLSADRKRSAEQRRCSAATRAAQYKMAAEASSVAEAGALDVGAVEADAAEALTAEARAADAAAESAEAGDESAPPRTIAAGAGAGAAWEDGERDVPQMRSATAAMARPAAPPSVRAHGTTAAVLSQLMSDYFAFRRRGAARRPRSKAPLAQRDGMVKRDVVVV
jgi:hypothetical protein